jgi:F-type H+-transporting ATPase subunit beta
VRQALQRAREWETAGVEAASLLPEDALLRARTRRLRRFLSQPFFVAEPFTGLPPRSVRREETLRACRAILDGEVDALPEEAFMFVGDLAEAKAER